MAPSVSERSYGDTDVCDRSAATRPLIRAAERLLDPLAVRFGGDHLAREPLEHLAAEGFAIDELERSKLGTVERVAAHKPTSGTSSLVGT